MAAGWAALVKYVDARYGGPCVVILRVTNFLDYGVDATAQDRDQNSFIERRIWVAGLNGSRLRPSRTCRKSRRTEQRESHPIRLDKMISVLYDSGTIGVVYRKCGARVLCG
jgi:hypothetical protein